MANLGDIGSSPAETVPSHFGGWFTRNKQPTPVYITVTGSTEGNRFHLFTAAGTFVDRANADASGEAHFFDLDDGAYVAYEVGTGNAWSVVVTGTTVTVIQIASTGSPIVVYAA